jgi:two-component system response regulator AtoC
LKVADGNRTQAAKLLGIDRVSLWRKLKKLGIESE